MNTFEARQYAALQRRELAEPGARCAKAHALHLIGLVERLADALDAARNELRQREDYTGLVEDWNGLVDGLRELGIDVSQPHPGPDWRWRFGIAAGSAATIPQAYLAALRAAGLVVPSDS